METLILKENETDKAAGILRRGGLVAMPTETVYGLAADALNGRAVANIFAAKGRPADNPLIVHISSLSMIPELVTDFPEKAKILAKRFWPGPLTIILPKSDRIPEEVSAGLDTVAIRFPSHPAAQSLISQSGPLAAPSANLSGSPSPTTFEHVLADMNGRIDAIIDGGDCDVGVESTVISLVCDPPRLLRPGGITVDQLRDAIGEVTVDDAVMNPLKDGAKAASPGMKYKHYSPKADVILVDSTQEEYLSFVNSKTGENAAALCYDEDLPLLEIQSISIGRSDDEAAQAHELFAALRRADEMGFATVYAHCPSTQGVGLAVYNRMIRAAGFQIIRPGGSQEKQE